MHRRTKHYLLFGQGLISGLHERAKTEWEKLGQNLVTFGNGIASQDLFFFSYIVMFKSLSHYLLIFLSFSKNRNAYFYVTFFRCIKINKHLSFRLLLPSAEGHFIPLVKCFKYILHCPCGAGVAEVLFMLLVFTSQRLCQNGNRKIKLAIIFKKLDLLDYASRTREVLSKWPSINFF